ncbi:MAG: undecaprenyl-diphosphate phosphatase [Kiritimatiellae bacterium]|nr:undecaprenyl-diphosphate phosphatase [Kiritimatiellia bacterium]
MLGTLKIAALAIFQGIAEFLPISSSGHLAIAERLMGVDNPGKSLELLLHLGTLLAVVVFYRRRLARLALGVVRREGASLREAAAIVASCIPAGVCYCLFGDFIESSLDGGMRFIGAMLLVTGCILLSTRFMPQGRVGRVGLGRAAAIGLAQAVALLPGISRSGATMSAGRLLGVDSREAADFSFLMTIPILLGAAVLEVASDGLAPLAALGVGHSALAFVLSAATGYIAIRYLIGILGGGKLWLFGLYCFAAGLVAIFFCA